MLISVDQEQAEVLREVLASNLKELRIESARADSHAFREALHARERTISAILSKLSEEVHVAI